MDKTSLYEKMRDLEPDQEKQKLFKHILDDLSEKKTTKLANRQLDHITNYLKAKNNG